MTKISAFTSVLKKIGWIWLGVYLLCALALYIFQEKVAFIPMQEKTEASEYFSWVQDITITTNDSEKLHGWYQDNHAKYLVIFFHGNGWNLLYNSDRLTFFKTLWVNTLMFDYRNYGESTGKISEQGMYDDGESAYDYAIKLGYKPENIFLWWHSFWGAIAVHTALWKNIKWLIVESSFLSFADMAKDRFPIFPVSLLLRLQFSTKDIIKQVKVPILVFHSKTDEIIPFVQWRTLYNLAEGNKKFMEVKWPHNGAFLISERLYIQTFTSFFQ